FARSPEFASIASSRSAPQELPRRLLGRMPKTQNGLRLPVRFIPMIFEASLANLCEDCMSPLGESFGSDAGGRARGREPRKLEGELAAGADAAGDGDLAP